MGWRWGLALKGGGAEGLGGGGPQASSDLPATPLAASSSCTSG